MGRTLKAASGGIHIFGLVAFAWSLPTFLVLSESDEFFVSYRASDWHVAAFALLCGLILPAAAGLLFEAVRRIKTKFDTPLLGISISVLVALALMPNMKKLPLLPGGVVIALCIMAGGLVAHAYFRSSNLRSAFTALAALAPAYALWFIWQWSILVPAESADRPYQLSQIDESRPPVVLIVFDQLSLQAIVNEDRSINGKAFPNFARLAGNSHWFRNASTVAEMTTAAVPAILTGRYGRGRPVRENYPSNAFTLFNALGYEVFANERATFLCPPGINSMKRGAPSLLGQARTFISDILIINGHIYLKEDMAVYLPTVDGVVSNFAQHSQRPVKSKDVSTGQHFDDLVLKRHHDFVMSLENEQARFYMVHFLTPHHPYRMLSSGKTYAFKDRPVLGTFILYNQDWPSDPYHGVRDMQRYYHQIGFVDGLLGEILDRMEAIGLYDEAIIVVTGDHGVSFRPEYGMRLVVRKGESQVADLNNAMDIIKTPTFIKLPHQREGRTIDSPFQSIDILPTLVDAIAGPIAPGSFDGRPMLSPDPAELVTHRLLSRNAGFIEHDLDFMDEGYDVASKFSVLDFDNQYALRGRFYEEFARDPLTIPLAPEPAAFRATLVDAKLYEDVQPDSNFVPAFVRARVGSRVAPEEKTPILITVNGKFGAVAPTYSLNKKIWISAIVDEELFRPGRNEIALYKIVEGGAGESLCRRIILKN